MVTAPLTPSSMQQHSGTSKKNVTVISSVLLGSLSGGSSTRASSPRPDGVNSQKQVVLVLVLVVAVVLVDVEVVVVLGGGAGGVVVVCGE